MRRPVRAGSDRWHEALHTTTAPLYLSCEVTLESVYIFFCVLTYSAARNHCKLAKLRTWQGTWRLARDHFTHIWHQAWHQAVECSKVSTTLTLHMITRTSREVRTRDAQQQHTKEPVQSPLLLLTYYCPLWSPVHPLSGPAVQ
eukprot:scaffold47182_cov57-Phaeocystis_antarctica.AAC.1